PLFKEAGKQARGSEERKGISVRRSIQNNRIKLPRFVEGIEALEGHVFLRSGVLFRDHLKDRVFENSLGQGRIRGEGVDKGFKRFTGVRNDRRQLRWSEGVFGES